MRVPHELSKKTKVFLMKSIIYSQKPWNPLLATPLPAPHILLSKTLDNSYVNKHETAISCLLRHNPYFIGVPVNVTIYTIYFSYAIDIGPCYVFRLPRSKEVMHFI